MAYTFDNLFAADPSNPTNVASNASILLYDPADPTKAPVTITDPTGSPIPNPVTVNKNGFGPAMQHATLDRLAWEGGGFSNFITSYEGMKNEAVSARTAAENAAATAGADAAAVADAAIGNATDEATAAAAAAEAAAADAASSAATATTAAGQAIATAAINGSGDLILTRANATSVNAGVAKGAKGDKGDKGDQGLPGTNAVATDTAVAGYITAASSETKTALTDSIADRVGTVNMLDYATTPIGAGNATNDTAALIAGIEGARVAKCNLALPPMKLLINAEITLPNITANVRKVGLIGAGTELTELQWSTDLGAGKYAIRTASGNADVGECFITGMTISGPNKTRALEVSPCQMMGFEASRKMHFVDVKTSYFKAGWLLNGDHISFLRCFAPNNYYGIYFANAAIDGDVSAIECDLSGTTMATLAVGVGGRLSAFSMLRGHIGFSPYGIFIEPGVAATISDTVVFGASFYGTSWEAFGAAACYDSDAIGYWRNMKFVDVANFSMLSNLAGNDYTNPSRGRPALFKLGTMVGWSFQGLTLANSTVRPDAMFAVGGYGILESEIRGERAAAFGDYITAGKKILAPGGGGTRSNLRFNGYGEAGILRRLSDQGTINAGDLVTLRTNDACQPNDSTGRLVGVAAYTEATLGAGVLILESSEMATVAFATAAPIMSAIVVSPTNPRKAAPRSEAPTAPVIGTLTTGSAAANGTASMFFRAQAG